MSSATSLYPLPCRKRADVAAEVREATDITAPGDGRIAAHAPNCPRASLSKTRSTRYTLAASLAVLSMASDV